MTTGTPEESLDANDLAEPAKERFNVLQASAERLAALVLPLTPDQLRQRAYPAEWTVADVLSHLGSGAAILQLRLDAILQGHEVGTDVIQPIWDEWNAKSPDQKAADALAADRAFLARLASLTAGEQARFRFVLGPLDVDLAGYLGLRLNEHVMHTWDVAVSLDPTATVPSDAVPFLFGAIEMIARFTGKSTGSDRTITILTTVPARHFAVSLRPDGVTVTTTAEGGTPDLELPAEAFIRLVYGRLDPDHTPPIQGAESDLEELRRVFPGV